MILVTLEGIPHSGRLALARALALVRPGWRWQQPVPARAEVQPSHCHAVFDGVWQNVQAVQASGPGDVVLLSTPWFPQHVFPQPCLQRLAEELLARLVAGVHRAPELHVMALLDCSPDEAFEQMVCSGNSVWNDTTLGDARTMGERARDVVDEAVARQHPFPCAALRVPCPPFFEENEVLLEQCAREIAAFVESRSPVARAPEPS